MRLKAFLRAEEECQIFRYVTQASSLTIFVLCPKMVLEFPYDFARAETSEL